MHKSLVFTALLAALTLGACSKKEEAPVVAPAPAVVAPVASAPAAPASMAAEAAPPAADAVAAALAAAASAAK